MFAMFAHVQLCLSDSVLLSYWVDKASNGEENLSHCTKA